MAMGTSRRIVLFANTDWYLWNFRRSLALGLREAGFDVLLLSPPGRHGPRLRRLGLDWRAIPMDRRSLRPSNEGRVLLHLVRLFREERPHLIHGFTIKCAVYGSLAARLAGVPARVNAITGLGYVFTSSDLRARALRPWVRMMLKLALSGANARLILQNPDDAAMIEQYALADRCSVRLIPGSGVDCQRFKPRQDARQEGRTRVLFPSRLLWDKGAAEFIDAARILRQEGRGIEFLVAGAPDPGNPAAVPERTINDWAKQGLVQWLGHVEDMPNLLASTDIAVLPSYREGLPKSLIEAAACGLALVTTDVPGCREVVSDGVDGLLVPARDSKRLAAAIARLHDDPKLARMLGSAARRKALRLFDERIVVDATIGVYEELLSPRGLG